MEEEKIIQDLNQKIVKNKKRIKNLRIRDDIVGFIPMIALSGTITSIYFKHNDIFFVKEFYPMSLFISLVIGGLPSTYLPTEKTINKIEKYQSEIDNALSELYDYAIEEDKKRMIKKQKDMI